MLRKCLLMLWCSGAIVWSMSPEKVRADQAIVGNEKNRKYGVMNPALVSIAYAGTESFRYDIAYTGGLKLGELDLEVRAVAGVADEFELYALITTEDSMFNVLYPVRDIHLTKVSGIERLPFSYEVWQKEGFNYRAHRLTEYDQEKGVISYWKNDKPPVVYKVDTPIHNEFSAFFASRLMEFTLSGSFYVPTFADKRRSEVEVKVLETSHFGNTALGPVDVYRVSPILKFKGLYNKRGDTTIWYTADECRVPVRITSKLAIGSVTATLQSYQNPLCSRYDKNGKLVMITEDVRGKTKVVQ